MAEQIEKQFEWAILLVFAFSMGLGLFEIARGALGGRYAGRHWKEMLTSFSVAVPTYALEALTGALLVAMYFAVYLWTPLQLPVNWWTFALALLAADFIHYWTHRWEHEVRLLWTHHSVHHSSHMYNLSTAFRVVFTRHFFDIFYYIGLVALGFHPLLVLSALGMVAVYQIWLHTELIGRLGWLEYVMMTPSHHRVHHGTQAKYLDKNYGGIFVIWDLLFGSFQPEEEPPVYGLTRPLGTSNPFVVHFHEYGALLRDLWRARDFGEFFGYLLRPPGWRPVASHGQAESLP